MERIKDFVNYEAFGAVGDGVTDDFDAILAAHAYANEHGLPVKAKSTAIYYIGEKFTRSIPVMYDVDFCGASFIVDDSVSNAFEYRELPLFFIKREKSVVLEGDELKSKLGDDVKIARGDRTFLWIVHLLEEESYIRVTNANHKDFVRFGSNQNNGNPRQDVFVVRKDGTLDDSTTPAFEFDEITRLEIFPAKEKLITVKNGNFASICCRSAKETEFKNKYRSFSRGFRIERSDVLIENMTHRMIDEPPFVIDSGIDELSSKFGERNESYPYQGFIVITLSNRIEIKNCLLTSHTTYYEDKPATVSTGWRVPNPVPMGSYDYYFHYSNDISLINVKQDCPTGIGDTRYWGIMASNNCKNLHLDGCYVNRFDAHRGFWNATIKNSTIGFAINITGGGHLYMENVTKLTGSAFLHIRGDYGGSFEGDIVLKNCHHSAIPGYNTARRETMSGEKCKDVYIIAPGDGGKNNYELFYNWDFGYELFMPTEITVENFTREGERLAVYTDQPNVKFENDYKHCHRITDSITFVDMKEIPKTANGESCTALNSVPVIIK